MMNQQDAPGAPGITPRWTSSAKEGIGAAYHTSSRVWFTVSHGIINEIYHPHLDTPNTRDLQLLVSDGETFFHEEKRDLQHRLERPELDAPLYKIVSSDPDGRYEITKTVICEPHSSVVLISVHVKVSDKSLRGKLKVFALLAPHLSNSGQHNSAELRDFAGRPYIAAERNGIHLMFGRYNHDGYGQYPDGRAFDGGGEGRSWPILTGERGHYELEAGRDPMPYINAMVGFASGSGMIAEQLWDAADLPDGEMRHGEPTGSVMPLCWSHAELLSLIRSHQDGVVHGRIAPVYRRYAKNATENKTEVWTFAHQPISVAAGKPLRIIVEAATRVRWTCDDWKSAQEIETETLPIGLHVVDLPIANLEGGAKVSFTFHWKNSGEWEKENFSIAVR